MTSRFFISQKKPPMAVKKALTSLLDSEYGEISDINFEFGHPLHGRLFFRILVDGHRELQCEPSDFYPILERLRDWMERCLVFDHLGELAFESVKLECRDDIYMLTLFHAGWAKDSLDTEPVSGLIVTRSRIEKPLISCFCVTSRLIYRLYKTIKKGIYSNRVAFNSPTNWWDSKRYDLLDNRTTADRLLERFYSEKLEKFIKSRLNNHL